MKKYLLSFALMFLGICSLSARGDYDFRIGISGEPSYQISQMSASWRGWNTWTTNESLSHIYQDYNGPLHTYGSVNAEFSVAVREKQRVGLSLGLNNMWYDCFNGVTDEKIASKTTTCINIAAIWRACYFSSDVVRIYGSISAGCHKFYGYDNLKYSYRDYDGNMQYVDDTLTGLFQITPVGFEFGKDVYGFAELGFGTIYTGVSVGVGYKF